MIRIREAIYGDLATVFHRTSVRDLIHRVYTNGYKPGSGSMYGKGFYGTYELSSQDSEYMSKTYGNIVVKFSVPVQDFIIFDEEEFMKTSNYKRMLREDPEAQFLIWQLEDFSGYEVEEKTRIEIEEFYATNPKYTSNLALKIWKDIYYICNGIIFTGSRDGHVLACYEPKLVIPLSFREDGKKDFEKVPTNLEYLSDYVDSKFEIEREIDWQDLPGKELTKLPKGIPEKIKGDFNCNNNNLASLAGALKEVGRDFHCKYNELTSLQGAPQKVGRNFICNNNYLTSLEGAPQKVGGDFYCDNNAKQFTEEEVRAVCDVSGRVFI